MLTFLPPSASTPVASDDRVEAHGWFRGVRASTTAARIQIDDLGALHQAEARRKLRAIAVELASGGSAPQIETPVVSTPDDLLRAVTLSLWLHFGGLGARLSVLIDRERLHPEVVAMFERAAARPALLLKTLDHAVFARMHHLVGSGDHDALRGFTPCLGFVSDIADGDRRLTSKLAKSLRIQKRNLQLMVTRRCHLRCVYCPTEKRDADLGMGDALRAIDLLLAGSSEGFRVDFTGGEPLLRMDWVRQLIDATHARAAAAGKRDGYYLVTNAIELTEEFCDFLAGHPIELEISIDGSELSHNRNKRALDRSINPYQTLLRNIRHVHDRGIRYNAVLVFTPDDFADLGNNLEHVLSLGFRNISINYAIGYHWEAEVLDAYVDLVGRFVERYDMLERGQEADFFITNLLYKSEPTVLNSELMVDTDGSLHLLSEWQFKKAFRRHPPPFGYALGDLRSIDDVLYTKAQVYQLLYEIYRSSDHPIDARENETLRIIHNSVEAGLRVSRGLSRVIDGRLAC